MTATTNISNPPITSGLRDTVQRLGLLTLLRNGRGLFRRDVANWVKAGCPSPAPVKVKLSVVKHYVEAYQTKTFIETGTFLGTMIEYIAATGVQCHTIEIDPTIHRRTSGVLAKHKNINFILGDSGEALPALLADLDHPATFWLDGHYSGSFTGRAEIDTPISAELDHILAHPIKKHVILIDDARDFDGTNNYPPLSILFKHFDEHSDYKVDVSTDIIRIVPR
jgi:hypothetical protein